jgi:hypothetical protein
MNGPQPKGQDSLPDSLRRFDQPGEGLRLKRINTLWITDHAILGVETETTGWDGEGNSKGGTATVRFNCTGYYDAKIKHSGDLLSSLEFTGVGRSEIRSLILGFEFAAASLSAQLTATSPRD